MIRYSCLLAQLDGLNPLNPTAPVTKGTGLLFMDIMVIIATGLALGLMLLLWARYYVRQRKRHSHRHEHRADPLPGVSLDGPEGDEERDHHGRRRRKRRLRRDHRPRNPTLAETGGLPPPKTEPTSNSPL
jgi:hypothetical protein